MPDLLTLRGMTWSHPRGYDPMVACSLIWREKTGVTIEWDKRSLQGFESFPVEELARTYDLIVLDHPHVGHVTAESCLLPLDIHGREAEREALQAASVGGSYASYQWNGRQWALPIDAASQVQAFRPDRIDAPPRSWAKVLQLARDGRVLCPLRPPHALMCFFTLAANLGPPCAGTEPGQLIDVEAGARVYNMIGNLARSIDPGCFDMDPIAVFERMAETQSRVACAPLIYGYVSYALDGFRPARLAFADIPAAGADGPVGSTLGGTGIAVSARTRHPAAAVDFAYWIAGADAQRGPYAAAGGQPGHGAAWDDAAVNEPVLGFYSNTRITLEGAWVRPRHDGYVAFQHAASERLSSGLRAGEGGYEVVSDLNRMFHESFAVRET